MWAKLNMTKFSNIVRLASILIGCVVGSQAWGESRTRYSLIRVPSADAAAMRFELASFARGSKLAMLDDSLKKGGGTILAEFTQVNPWHAEPVDLQKVTGKIQAGGEELELGVKLKIEGSGDPLVTHSAEVTLPTGGKGARFFQMIGGSAIRQPAAWHERCCWSDGKECLMLWEYPVREGESEEEAVQGNSAVQVEMRWFQANEADITKLGASKPETREKALQWLAGRAKLWREAGYGFKVGNPSVWQMTQGKHDPERGESISDESFTIQTKCQEEEGKLKMVWTTSVGKKGQEESTTLNAGMTSGVWEFLPVQGNPDANVIACRVTKL